MRICDSHDRLGRDGAPTARVIESSHARSAAGFNNFLRSYHEELAQYLTREKHDFEDIRSRNPNNTFYALNQSRWNAILVLQYVQYALFVYLGHGYVHRFYTFSVHVHSLISQFLGEEWSSPSCLEPRKRIGAPLQYYYYYYYTLSSVSPLL